MSELTPPWKWARMTAAQVKSYIKDLEQKRKIAQDKLDKARASWELDTDPKELERLEKALDEI